MSSLRVIAVPCLSDNYAYLVAREGSSDCFVVDPSEAEPVLVALARGGLKLRAIASTHHHYDHVGGNEQLIDKLGPLLVYAHPHDQGRVPGQNASAEEGQPFTLAGLSVTAVHVPGHTLGAVAYRVDDAVFTGDTLFVAGCGRIFEGTPAQLHASLTRLGRLPAETRVYCGHEYTAANLRFAAHIDPSNEAVMQKMERVAALRERGEPTVPSTIGDERATNPFLRTAEPALRQRFAGNEVEVFAALRAAKDSFS
jgi:hydroxyacylglutathione hydrolase